jgi:hypothetical protein
VGHFQPEKEWHLQKPGRMRETPATIDPIGGLVNISAAEEYVRPEFVWDENTKTMRYSVAACERCKYITPATRGPLNCPACSSSGDLVMVDRLVTHAEYVALINAFLLQHAT